MRAYVIAEVGSNWHDLPDAKQLILAAAAAGADAVKFQLFTAAGLAHPEYPAYKTLQRHSLPREWLPELKAVADNAGIEFSATPTDMEAVALLDALAVPWIKIASGDITHHALIAAVARTGRRGLISTGAATMAEITTAYRVWQRARQMDGADCTMLQCTVEYPAVAAHAGLTDMADLLSCFGTAGFSDHTLSLSLPAVAVALGATVIEKHFTLSRQQTGPDHPHSLEPMEFERMVKNIRDAAAANIRTRGRLASEPEMRQIARRGVYYAADLPAGHVLRHEDLLTVRPANEIHPHEAAEMVGLTLACSVTAYQDASWHYILRAAEG